MNIFGKERTRRDLEAYTGQIDQVAGIRRAVLDDGRERGIRVADVRNGGGLQFTVLLDRGLDIGDAAYNGIPLALRTPCEYAAPAFHDEYGTGWLRAWGGGLLTGCGLRNVGVSGIVDGESMPFHGRLSNSPARNVSANAEWLDDRTCVLTVEGEVMQTRMFGENMRLKRKITTAVGSSAFTVEDTVRNNGFRTEPVFILYHTNWGFPMLDENASLETVEHKVEPRDDIAADGGEEWMNMQPPTPAYREKVYFHDLPPDEDGWVCMTLRSPGTGLAATVSWPKAELPKLIEWKMMNQGEYALGIEPSNCTVLGRAEALKEGPHCLLEPGQSSTFHVTIAIHPMQS